ncbi:hypothetical protein VSS74_27265 [Conexibacter stalactiti]|uniref:Photosynthesis system II assembly factor Ycf48/Hcf136-like domain-containing protein n=1 Tax=Conexibacter stalactiti TaxID=1940611 RepID=A0ABU4HXP0_9ACTN|nr:hypothetical protein [Conexibacter stalactiti]MDW5598086.1 hypothetical protein [Conexibacter stalactiti]MEC5038728.1 hypothetical protein [Conexibacter stalactiti]
MVAAVAALASVAVAHPARAATWTVVPSNTTQDIVALEYRSDTQAWLATANGQLLTAGPDGRFTPRYDVPGMTFTDLAFRPDGAVGIAVTAAGRALRSTDGGASWSVLPLPLVGSRCDASARPALIPNFNAVAWAGDDTGYLVGGGNRIPVVVRVTGAAGPSPVASDANWTGSTCRVGSWINFPTDVFSVPGNPSALRFIGSYFGTVFASNDGLATPALVRGEMINSGETLPRFAIDPENPNRIWAVDHGSIHCNALCFAYSVDGGSAHQRMTVVNPTTTLRRYLFDVAYAGGTTMAVGDNGEIYASTATSTAFLTPPAGALAGHTWKAVDLADGSRALVGGAGGALIRTADAGGAPAAVPPTAPPPLPPQPAPVPAPSPTPVPAKAYRPGNASTPSTWRTAGVRITVWRRVTIAKGRYLTVRVVGTAQRKLTIVVRRATGARRTTARTSVTTRSGTTTVRVPLGRGARPGRHVVTIRVWQGKRPLGRTVRTEARLLR